MRVGPERGPFKPICKRRDHDAQGRFLHAPLGIITPAFQAKRRRLDVARGGVTSARDNGPRE